MISSALRSPCSTLRQFTRAATSKGLTKIRSLSTTAPVKKNVLVAVGPGTEDIEAVTVVDVLRRAGANVVVGSVVDSLNVTFAHGTKVIADALVRDLEASKKDFDMIVCPGGMKGAEAIRDCIPFQKMIHAHAAKNKLIGAICAAPVIVLNSLNLLGDKKIVCYPSMMSMIDKANQGSGTVLVDGNIITSQGPGTSNTFAIKLVSMLFDTIKANNIARDMLI